MQLIAGLPVIFPKPALLWTFGDDHNRDREAVPWTGKSDSLKGADKDKNEWYKRGKCLATHIFHAVERTGEVMACPVIIMG